jgi:methionine-rich copper-binding protein CopC
MWALLAVVFLTAAVASPAAAHTELVSSSPEDGQQLSVPPEQINLRFGEDLLTGGAQVVAKDDTGVKVGLGPAEVTGTKLTATWPQTADNGTYTVAWRAVADDGHPLEGTFTFAVKAAQPEAASASPEPLTASPSPAAATDDESGQGMNLLLPALFVVALAAVGFFVWRSRAD